MNWIALWITPACDMGSQVVEDAPGYERVRIAPQPTDRLDWLAASIDTKRGLVSSPGRRLSP